MSFTYCKSCGYKNTYATQPPKFCSSCGEPLGGISKAMPQVISKPSRKTIDDEDGEDIFDVPSVSNFKCKVLRSDMGTRKIKLSDLVPDIEEQAGDQFGNEETQETRKE